MAELDDARWAEIRQLYETSDLSVAAIAQRFGITLGRLYLRREIEGWPRRSEMTPEMIAKAESRYRLGVARARTAAKVVADAPRGGDDEDADDGEAERDAPAASLATRRTAAKRNGRGARFGRPVGTRAMGNQALLSRMVRLIERNLEIMENEMDAENAGAGSPGEPERNARTMGTLVRTLEKVTELKTPDDDAAVTADIDRDATAELRRELAERLYRMWGGTKR